MHTDNINIIIGRFQPFHNGHLELVLKALEGNTDKLIIFIGSAQESRTNRNPFTYFERSVMIRGALQDIDIGLCQRVSIHPLSDHTDDSEWLKQLEEELEDYPNRTFVHVNKDLDTEVNNTLVSNLPSTIMKTVESTNIINATDIRARLFPELDFVTIISLVPMSTFRCLVDIFQDWKIK